jgi:membrane dipeptidase
MDRRSFLLAGLAAPFAFSRSAIAGDEIYLADMHFHLFFFGDNTPKRKPLAATMAAGNVKLLAWSLVGDVPWIRPSAQGLRQIADPKPGEALNWFENDIARIKAHLAEQNLKIVLTPDDVDSALKGQPHVVLAVEGASFVDADPSQLKRAYDLGVRHLQLVHYIKNPLGDFQTAKPEHDGLTDLGKQVVEECNRLGILVDLAHCSADAVSQALETSKAPVVWSHSSVTRTGKPNWTMAAWKARQLSLDGAKAIAAKGGVVGLWAMRSDVGGGIEAYAARLAEMADWLGDDHVAFGTDTNAIVNPAIANYADLREVVLLWQERGTSHDRIRKIAIENYARVLKQAMGGRQV